MAAFEYKGELITSLGAPKAHFLFNTFTEVVSFFLLISELDKFKQMQICWRHFNPILMQMMRRGLILRAKAQPVPSARRGKNGFQTEEKKRQVYRRQSKKVEAGAAAGVRVGRHLQGSAGQISARLQHDDMVLFLLKTSWT